MFKKFLLRRKTRFVLNKHFNFSVKDLSRVCLYEAVDETLEKSENEYDAAIKFMFKICLHKSFLINRDFEVFIPRLSSNMNRIILFIKGDKDKVLNILNGLRYKHKIKPFEWNY